MKKEIRLMILKIKSTTFIADNLKDSRMREKHMKI